MRNRQIYIKKSRQFFPAGPASYLMIYGWILIACGLLWSNWAEFSVWQKNIWLSISSQIRMFIIWFIGKPWSCNYFRFSSCTNNLFKYIWYKEVCAAVLKPGIMWTYIIYTRCGPIWKYYSYFDQYDRSSYHFSCAKQIRGCDKIMSQPLICWRCPFL